MPVPWPYQRSPEHHGVARPACQSTAAAARRDEAGGAAHAGAVVHSRAKRPQHSRLQSTAAAAEQCGTPHSRLQSCTAGQRGRRHSRLQSPAAGFSHRQQRTAMRMEPL